jgi:hypothetical protein
MYSFMRNGTEIQTWDLFQGIPKHTVNLNEKIKDILVFPEILEIIAMTDNPNSSHTDITIFHKDNSRLS